jgi:transcription elongation factor Elf1
MIEGDKVYIPRKRKPSKYHRCSVCDISMSGDPNMGMRKMIVCKPCYHALEVRIRRLEAKYEI